MVKIFKYILKLLQILVFRVNLLQHSKNVPLHISGEALRLCDLLW